MIIRWVRGECMHAAQLKKRLIAHRGFQSRYPENTLLAIDAALKMKVDAIEVDIRLVEDQLIVIHDRWLNKTTNGRGRISDKGLKELRALDAGKGQQIPLLWEVLERVSGRCDINVELKSERTAMPVVVMLQRAIKTLGFSLQQFLLSSFNHHLLNEIKQQDPNWRVGALIACLPLEYAAFAKKLDAYSVHIDVDFVNKAFVEDAHSRGLKVFVYTVDEEEDIDLDELEVKPIKHKEIE